MTRTRTAFAGLLISAVALLAACVPPADPGGTTTTTSTAPSDIAVSDATLRWSYSEYAQYGIFGAWRMWTNPAASTNPTIQTEDGQSITGDPAEAGKAYNLAQFTGGTGSLNPVTGEGTISWDTDSWVINGYPAVYGAPDETLSDPILTIDADGSGTLSFEALIPAHVDMGGNSVPAKGPERKVLATFDGLDAFTSSSIEVLPDFAGRAYIPGTGDAPWQECSGAGGSWPAEWVDFVPSSIRSHYYSTGCGGLQDRKPPTPVNIAW